MSRFALSGFYGVARVVLVIAATCFLTACSGWQTPLDPHSSAAANLARLFWFFVVVCAGVWLLVMAALAYSGVRTKSGNDTPTQDNPDQQRRKTWVVSGAVGATAVILAVFALSSFYTTRSFAWPEDKAFKIKVTGHQWWWEVQYQSGTPSRIFTTANEIHIPVGRPVTLDLESEDVIHSFWVPGLMGKQDLIPGRTNYLTLRADKPGIYRGQCAEFCGLEHAHMSIFVAADPPAQFERWLQHQMSAPTPAPNTGRGAQVFLTNGCASCHTISGSDAGGRVGPDLSHFGSRSTIAAGLLSNTPAHLAHWIADPQALKPYCAMPAVPLSGPDLQAVVTYLQGLK